MTTSVQLYLLLILALYGERLVELVVSRRNIRGLLARGGHEYGRGHFPPMALFHALFPAAALAEVLVLERSFPGIPGYISLTVVLLAQGLRWWTVATLGPAWSVRVVVVPDAPPVTRGPYRFLKHPNYLAVVLEVAAVPLVHGAWLTAIIATLLNAGLLWVRIPLEERAMGPGYAAAFGRRTSTQEKGAVVNEREQEVLAEIRKILIVQLEATDTVMASDGLADCEVLDSLGLITLAVGLENRFRVCLSEEDAPGLSTFGDVIRLVNRRREEAGK